ncbi:hypothetical protein ACEQ8H_005433 [Pleosporales sp. CAS-2024a]
MNSKSTLDSTTGHDDQAPDIDMGDDDLSCKIDAIAALDEMQNRDRAEKDIQENAGTASTLQEEAPRLILGGADTVYLSQQFRSNQDITDLVNAIIPRGRMQVAPTAGNRSEDELAEECAKKVFGVQHRVIYIHLNSDQKKTLVSCSRYNDKFMHAIWGSVFALIHEGVDPSTITILTPYTAQVDAHRRVQQDLVRSVLEWTDPAGRRDCYAQPCLCDAKDNELINCRQQCDATQASLQKAKDEIDRINNQHSRQVALCNGAATAFASACFDDLHVPHAEWPILVVGLETACMNWSRIRSAKLWLTETRDEIENLSKWLYKELGSDPKPKRKTPKKQKDRSIEDVITAPPSPFAPVAPAPPAAHVMPSMSEPFSASRYRFGVTPPAPQFAVPAMPARRDRVSFDPQPQYDAPSSWQAPTTSTRHFPSSSSVPMGGMDDDETPRGRSAQQRREDEVVEQYRRELRAQQERFDR